MLNQYSTTPALQSPAVILRHLYLSPEHNFFGHHGQPAGTAPMIEVPEVECVAGKGLRGDRFFGWKEDYKGQVTFFEEEQYERLCEQLAVTHLPQVAACADQHLMVAKRTDKGQTTSTVEAVHGEQRVGEVARMLGGEKLSGTTLAHAKEMLGQ